MNIHDLLFCVFTSRELVCGLLVITSRKSRHGAMSWVCCLCLWRGSFLLLEALFIAAIRCWFMAGAVMVFFLFSSSCARHQGQRTPEIKALGVFGGIAVAVAFVWELAIILSQSVKPSTVTERSTRRLENRQPFLRITCCRFEVTALLLLVADGSGWCCSRRRSSNDQRG